MKTLLRLTDTGAYFDPDEVMAIVPNLGPARPGQEPEVKGSLIYLKGRDEPLLTTLPPDKLTWPVIYRGAE